MFSFIKKIFHIGNPSINEEPDNLPSRDQMRSFLITNASSKLGVCCIFFYMLFYDYPR